MQRGDDFAAMPAARVLSRGLGALLVCAGAVLAGASPAWSQISVHQQQLFERTIREPMNHEATFEYARVATANGDFEAAIGALERLLFYNPGLTRVKYELGTLYFRMGSYEMAKRYFTEALSDPNLNPVTRERVVSAETCRCTLAVMTTAGLYETSGDWLYEIGLPGKSGIGGGIVTVAPGKGGLGTFAPPLDAAGNSVRGQLAARFLSRQLGLDIFVSEPAP